jgi:hypothetical protein
MDFTLSSQWLNFAAAGFYLFGQFATKKPAGTSDGMPRDFEKRALGFHRREKEGGVERRLKPSLRENLFGTVLFGVLLSRFFRMMSGMQVVTVRDVSMMRDLLVVPARLMLGRFFVMASRMFMVLCRLGMMFRWLTHMEGIGRFGFDRYRLRFVNPVDDTMEANKPAKLQFRHSFRLRIASHMRQAENTMKRRVRKASDDRIALPKREV